MPDVQVGLEDPEGVDGAPRDPWDVSMPVRDATVALRHLRRPFTPEAIRFKIQSSWGSGALIVPYIDARLVVERLNAVVSTSWQDTYEETHGGMVCHLELAGITRSDVGVGQGATEGMKAKAAYSDALKRAAVKFGVGVSLYAIPKIMLAAPSKHLAGEGKKIRITDFGDEKLRKGYGEWLEAHGRVKFGPAFDHGDVGPSTDPDEAPEGAEPVVERVSGPEVAELRQRSMAAYDEIVKSEGRAAYPPAQFRANSDAALESMEALTLFVSGLEKRAQG